MIKSNLKACGQGVAYNRQGNIKNDTETSLKLLHGPDFQKSEHQNNDSGSWHFYVKNGGIEKSSFGENHRNNCFR